MKYFTGVGSRETPEDILELMRDIAFKLSQSDYILRSGGADGADKAFEEGARNSFSSVKPNIYIPWWGFNGNRDRDMYICTDDIPPEIVEHALMQAKQTHPAWDRLKPGAKALHTRNVFQVLGDSIEGVWPSDFLICWAKPVGSSLTGGTRTAWELARNWRVKSYNLYFDEAEERMRRWLK